MSTATRKESGGDEQPERPRPPNLMPVKSLYWGADRRLRINQGAVREKTLTTGVFLEEEQQNENGHKENACAENGIGGPPTDMLDKVLSDWRVGHRGQATSQAHEAESKSSMPVKPS